MEALDLGSHDVHLWWIDLARCRDGAEALSLEERQRAVRLRRPDERRRWIASRAALRGILARYVGLTPCDVSLLVDAHGKPALSGGGPQFNLSHGGERALLAVSRCVVGVDLEPVDERAVAPADVKRLVAKVCSAREAARLWALPEGDRRLALLRLWVLKEAYLKGVGVGLGREMRAVVPHPRPLSHRNGRGEPDVEGGCHSETLPDVNTPSPIAMGEGWGEGLLGSADGVTSEYAIADHPDWTLQLLDAGPGWVAALAVRAEAARIMARHWPEAERGAELSGDVSF